MPSLRNITATAPYGHAGGHSDLRAFVMYHADPVACLKAYTTQTILAEFAPAKPDWAVLNDPSEIAAISQAVQQPPQPLTDPEVTAILAFLDSLTDPTAIAGRLGIPAAVPSGLPIDR